GEKRTELFASQHNVSASEALAILRGDFTIHDYVVNRECQSASRRAGAALLQCRQEVETEAADRAQEGTRGGDQAIRALGDLLTGLKTIEGPKTLLVVSEGFLSTESTISITEL